MYFSDGLLFSTSDLIGEEETEKPKTENPKKASTKKPQNPLTSSSVKGEMISFMKTQKLHPPQYFFKGFHVSNFSVD